MMLKCSRSGYYAWIESGRPLYKKYDTKISDHVLKLYDEDTRRGITRIKMQFKKQYGINITKKTVYGYMKIHGIQSIIRKKRKKYSKVEHHKITNLIKRDFKATKPNSKWSIDITYLHTVQGTEYLCAIKDMYDKSIIAYNLSVHNDNNLVFQTLDKAFSSIKTEHRNSLILHSDQGSQFTSPKYAKILKENQVEHSVSARGSCVDNVPIESWFSALKTECIYLKGNCTRKEMRENVIEYICYYNEKRLQEQLKELTPFEYRVLALAS